MSKTWDNSSFFDLQNLFNVEGQMMVITIYTNRKSLILGDFQEAQIRVRPLLYASVTTSSLGKRIA
ncbi:hypothetical protein JHK82_026965 [Glycine max]|uniref:Uncharacterized protein n=2 Tax=Glycine subgen. Soja TaxID=1462606 RepID=K7LHI5_SOYBN|nr:hypothetical protein JHK87_026844 [Glycine soja]KAG4996148.1 hypothetical protein JHK85_027587 [Glycine max]KAG5002949.1 hypothetical protein JHK86_027088 [Glycine max]KAG5126130.1 hypothetical protein JHK82_026965 [Glycine max]KAG5150722.1 hypothetical protein JHK84_027194 [Glycine max]